MPHEHILVDTCTSEDCSDLGHQISHDGDALHPESHLGNHGADLSCASCSAHASSVFATWQHNVLMLSPSESIVRGHPQNDRLPGDPVDELERPPLI